MFSIIFLLACATFAGAEQTPSEPSPVGARTITHAQIETRYADAQSRFAMVDDVRIHYKDEGQGRAILLIHGSLGDLSDWDGWTTALTKKYRVVRLDLPGFGLSGEIANGNYSIDRNLSLIDGLMDSLGIERKLDIANVIGRDREGAIMIGQYVRGDPERVLAHVRAPTLVLWGAAERSLSVETADRFVAALKNARVVRKLMQEHGDHAMHIEWPQATAEKVRDFLDSEYR